MIYSHAYVVWPIIIIHGHHGYFGNDNVKYYCQKNAINTIFNEGKLEILEG